MSSSTPEGTWTWNLLLQTTLSPFGFWNARNNLFFLQLWKEIKSPVIENRPVSILNISQLYCTTTTGNHYSQRPAQLNCHVWCVPFSNLTRHEKEVVFYQTLTHLCTSGHLRLSLESTEKQKLTECYSSLPNVDTKNTLYELAPQKFSYKCYLTRNITSVFA